MVAIKGNLMEPVGVDERYRVPEIFRHQLSSGDTVYGVIFKPQSLDESRPHKFPTVLTIYGGPEVQLVTNTFKVRSDFIITEKGGHGLLFNAFILSFRIIKVQMFTAYSCLQLDFI